MSEFKHIQMITQKVLSQQLQKVQTVQLIPVQLQKKMQML